ncbi:lipid A biosynthesis acyltransferase [Anaerosporomusa subterranea]|uniref:Lipid A biosynthesis acyltransferase n=1 Tax=Anaerosporomusa subterranea TaxID=1794912 RepID=A0A154BR27_ANASB|nr:lysophospholipid acyltransferase family protein [Anaerosporomusa subterranea]KYZ76386.1 lipid A biosynthesis acyltransferase [Anaerosporomusa subterranea]
MQYWILKTISRILCLLPYCLLLSLGKGLGRLYYLLAKSQRKLALTQIQERMNLSPEEAEKTIRQLFINLAQTFLEIMYMPRLNKTTINNYVDIENRHYLDAAMAEGKGIAILAAHFGNWEWLGAGLALNGYPLAAVFKGQPNDQHTRLLTEYRQHVGMEVYAKGGNEVLGLVKAFKRGQAVGLISDQNAGKTGITLDFFGKPSSTHSGISVFAAKLGCPVVPIFIVRRPEGGHRILVQPPHHFEHTGHQAEDITAFTAKMSKIIEDIIRQYPDHWIWFHKRWRDPHHGRAASGGDMQ